MTATFTNGINPRITIHNDLGSPVAITSVEGAKALVLELVTAINVAVKEGAE
jgi:hypothetical protein